MMLMTTVTKRPSISSRRSLYFLFRVYFMTLSFTGLMGSCATLKQKFSKKESQMISLSHQQVLKDQSEFMERREQELINYFGESVTLIIKDGFRFHQDSGLLANSALLHYQVQSLATEKKKDSSKVTHLSEISSFEDVQLKTLDIEKQKNKSISNWWLLLLIPLIWFIRNLFFFISINCLKRR